MRWFITLGGLAAVLALPMPLSSQGARGGVSRPAAASHATPNFSRPATTRPMTVVRPPTPHLGYNPPRPATISRPTISGPSTVGGAAMISRPSISTGAATAVRPRPGGTGPTISYRPSTITPTITRPSTGAASVSPSTRPSIVGRPNVTGPGTGVSAASTTRPAITTRPTRPAIGTGPGSFDRPSITTRPARPDRPAITTRPAARPATVARPSFDLGKRPIHHDINNININRWNQYGRQAYAHRPWYAGHPGYWNRPWYANRPAWYWNRPWYNYHWHWHHGYWNYWASLPAFWVYSGLWAASALSPGATYIYYNPYYTQPPNVIVLGALDYSSPLPAPVVDQATLAYPPAPDQQVLVEGAALPTTAPPAPDTSNDAVAEANRQFDAARATFKGGNYVEAQRLVEKAIEKLPSDATLHEFRALTLFAQSRYKEAAATLYAVLAAGPGWDWSTLAGLYADEAAYTQQLRTLEEYMRTHPQEADAHFVLAYHYLVLGHKAEAVKQLEQVVRLQPDDKLSAALLKALTTEPATTAAAAEPPPIGER